MIYRTQSLDECRTLFPDGSELAERIFQLAQERIPDQSKRERGSYSILGTSTPERVGKLVIDTGRKLRRGVYVLVRASDEVGQRIQESGLESEFIEFFARMDRNGTIAPLPHPTKEFRYFRVGDDDDVDRIVALLMRCARV